MIVLDLKFINAIFHISKIWFSKLIFIQLNLCINLSDLISLVSKVVNACLIMNLVAMLLWVQLQLLLVRIIEALRNIRTHRAQYNQYFLTLLENDNIFLYSKNMNETNRKTAALHVLDQHHLVTRL